MSAKPPIKLASLRSGMNRSGLAIKVKVDREHPSGTDKPPATPQYQRAPAPSKPSASVSKPAPAQRKRASIHDVPVAQRQRLMWGVVGLGVLVVGLGWIMTFGANLRSAAGGPNLFRDIANIFQSNPLSKKKATPQSAEIRSLEEQVFPQFQQ